MRLLHVKTLKMRDFPKEPPLYAILPHTWGDEEVSLQEFASDDRETKKGFAKIKGCCRQAHSDGLDWVWIDTCCIDKTSSVELSEVINSMYAWYRDSQVCYAFLDDIPTGHLVHVPGKFPNARWFTRGWCLQELIAPSTVEFYAADWSEIGTKHSLADRICNITRVPEKCCIAEEMSWASGRKTTRVEDEAFCLLGIFGVNMPMLYGEGQNAFFRLQEEMLKHTEDYTFLLWENLSGPSTSAFSAATSNFSPQELLYCSVNYRKPSDAVSNSRNTVPSDIFPPPQITSRGLRISLAMTTKKEPCNTVAQQEATLWIPYLCEDRIHGITVQRSLSPLGKYCTIPNLRSESKIVTVFLQQGESDLEGIDWEFHDMYLDANRESANWRDLRSREQTGEHPELSFLDILLAAPRGAVVELSDAFWYGANITPYFQVFQYHDHCHQEEEGFETTVCLRARLELEDLLFQFDPAETKTPHSQSLTLQISLAQCTVRPDWLDCVSTEPDLVTVDFSVGPTPTMCMMKRGNGDAPWVYPRESDRASYSILSDTAVVTAAVKTVSRPAGSDPHNNGRTPCECADATTTTVRLRITWNLYDRADNTHQLPWYPFEDQESLAHQLPYPFEDQDSLELLYSMSVDPLSPERF